MVGNLIRFSKGEPDFLLLTVGGILALLAAWLVVESVIALLRGTRRQRAEIEVA